MLAYAFLKQLNQSLDPLGEFNEDDENDGEEPANIDSASNISKPADKKSKSRAAGSGAGAGGSARKGLQLMTTLAMMYAQLSKQSIRELYVSQHPAYWS